MAASDVYVPSAHAVIVLFVDGDADTLAAYQTLAADEGFDAELARDGKEALALANFVLPDVIVLDVDLPDIDGFEVARRLRTSARTKSIPIIIVNARSREAAFASARAHECEGHLTKPCSINALLELLNALAPRSSDAPPSRAGAQ